MSAAAVAGEGGVSGGGWSPVGESRHVPGKAAYTPGTVVFLSVK